MIRVPLTFHNPEMVYNFLKTQVGPLYMAIKNNQAILHFAKPEHAQLALSTFQNSTLNGLPLQLMPYVEGDIEDRNLNHCSSASMQPEQNGNEVDVPPPKLSEFTMLIEDSLKVKDPEDPFQNITKSNREEFIKFISSYNPLLQTAQKKKEEIVTKFQKENQSHKVSQFQKFYRKGLLDLAQMTKQNFRAFRKKCASFGQHEKVDLDPVISISLTHPLKPLENQSFRTNIQYINKEINELKRVTPLSDSHFICSAFNYNEGRLLVYNVDNEYIQEIVKVKEGAYGLLVLDQYILVGTNQGSIAFFTSPEDSKKQLSLKLHGGMIYEVVKNSNRLGGYNIMTLGCDFMLKLWSASVDNISEESNTLFFEENMKISCNNGKQISSVTVLQQGQKIAYSNQKNLYLHDCVSANPISTVQCKGSILKISTLDENNIGVANEKYLSFVDTRNNANTLNYKINKDIRTVTTLNTNSLLYGCTDGEVGLVDRRNSKSLWRSTVNHQGQVYDICRMGDLIISADNKGQIASWAPNSLTVGSQ